MKRLLLFICVLFATAKAQTPCDSYTVKKTDELSGQSTITSRKPVLLSDDNKKGVRIDFNRFSISGIEYISIDFVAVGEGTECVDKDSKIIFLFENETRLQRYNFRRFNCKNEAALLFNISSPDLQLLTDNRIKMLGVYMYDGLVVKRELTAQQQNEFINSLECIINFQ